MNRLILVRKLAAIAAKTMPYKDRDPHGSQRSTNMFGGQRDGRRPTEPTPPIEGRTQAEVSRYLETIWNTFGSQATIVSLIDIESVNGKVSRFGFKIATHASYSDEQLENYFAKKFPNEIPTDIPILFKLLEETTTSGVYTSVEERVYHRDHPEGFEFVSPSLVAIHMEAVEKAQEEKEKIRMEIERKRVKAGTLSEYGIDDPDPKMTLKGVEVDEENLKSEPIDQRQIAPPQERQQETQVQVDPQQKTEAQAPVTVEPSSTTEKTFERFKGTTPGASEINITPDLIIFQWKAQRKHGGMNDWKTESNSSPETDPQDAAKVETEATEQPVSDFDPTSPNAIFAKWLVETGTQEGKKLSDWDIPDPLPTSSSGKPTRDKETLLYERPVDAFHFMNGENT